MQRFIDDGRGYFMTISCRKSTILPDYSIVGSMPSACVVLPFILGGKEKEVSDSLDYLENGMMHFDSQFSLPYPSELCIQIILWLSQVTKW